MAPPIQVFEYESLTLYGDKSLTKVQLEKLYEFNDRNGNVYFTGIRNGIQFNSYVGVIQIGGLTIEILPKVDKETSSTKQEYKKWHSALLKMLAVCKKIKVDSVSEAQLNKRYYSILELYFDLFLDEVNTLLRRGLVKKYRKASGNTLALKGRLLFSKNIQHNLIHQERFYTQHQVYDHETLINQILIKALRTLSKITTNAIFKDKVSRLILDFPDIKEIAISESHFNQIRSSRKTESYREALKIAKMIILNYSPDLSRGGEDMLALLFDMNKLWEEYIFRMLRRSNREGYNISPQDSKPFWERKTIRPDIVITNDKGGKFIIDTKWKLVDSNNPSDEDLKQMFAYNLYWESQKSMLLYPKVKDQADEYFGQYHKGQKSPHYCKLGFVSVLDENGFLNMNVGEELFRKLD